MAHTLSIEEFIESELEYFLPMQVRSEAASEELRIAWREETISQRSERVSIETYDLCNGEVKYGPFKGLKLSENSWWGKSDLGSQCLGLYEKEILTHIKNSSSQSWDCFIDIGAADGYYAVGMLSSGTANRAICFELSREGRALIRDTWERNGRIGVLDVHGKADADALLSLDQEGLGKTLILIDIEGDEFELLTPEVIEHLSAAEVILEVHNWVHDFEAKYARLLYDLSKWFRLDILAYEDRLTGAFEELRSYTDDNRLLLVSERRPCRMRFLSLTPLTEDTV